MEKQYATRIGIVLFKITSKRCITYQKVKRKKSVLVMIDGHEVGAFMIVILERERDVCLCLINAPFCFVIK